MRGSIHAEEVRVQPRPYQVAAHDAIWAKFDGGDPSTIAVMPTGTGKTTVAAMVAQAAKDRGMRTLFLAHREVLFHYPMRQAVLDGEISA
jgi:superfamily II DNA or RNA helicase